MKRALVFLFSALLLLGLFVSCDNSTNANKGLVTIHLDAAVGKSLSTSMDYVAFDKLDWYYQAETDSDIFNYGEKTEWTKLDDGLGGTIELSQGIWDFDLIAVPAGTEELNESAIMFAGGVENVLVTAQASGESLEIYIPVYAQMAGTGFLSFGDIKIVLRDGTNAPVAPNYIVFDGEEGHGTLPEEKVAVPTGTHTIKLCYMDPADGVVKAEETVVVTLFSGATVTISGIISEVTEEAIVDCVYCVSSYEALKEIIRLVDEAKIILIDDIEVQDTFVIPADKKIEIDLNGYTISQDEECTAGYSMIENKGSLTIKDSYGDGKILFKNTVAESYTLTNSGTLTINSGTVEVNGTYGSLAIKQIDGEASINGGVIKNSRTSVSVNAGKFVINDGKFIGDVLAQPSIGDVTLEINGGEFSGSAFGWAVFVSNQGVNYNVRTTINGGVFLKGLGAGNTTRDGVMGCILKGTFTASAKSGTNNALFADNAEITLLAE